MAAILEIAVDELVAPSTFVEHARNRDGVSMIVPGFHVRGMEIWGATAMVLAEFLTLLGWNGRQSLTNVISCLACTSMASL